MKFEQEANSFGINLSDKDCQIILEVYKVKPGDESCLDINFDAALKSIVPILTKNTDQHLINKH